MSGKPPGIMMCQRPLKNKNDMTDQATTII